MYPGRASERKSRAVLLALLATCALVACHGSVRAPEGPPQFAPRVDTRGAAVYDVDRAASRVVVHVFRGGPLARLGHNHVVSSRDLEGRIFLHPTFTRSSFELAFPVAQLVVDDPELRKAAGAEFSSVPSEEDREGTRRNMLRASVLDAQRFPDVKVVSTRVGGSLGAPEIVARITIRDAARDIAIPVSLQLDGERLRAKGAFDIKQTDFGIEPFSVVLGALQVEDRLHVEFDVTAVKK